MDNPTQMPTDRERATSLLLSLCPVWPSVDCVRSAQIRAMYLPQYIDSYVDFSQEYPHLHTLRIIFNQVSEHSDVVRLSKLTDTGSSSFQSLHRTTWLSWRSVMQRTDEPALVLLPRGTAAHLIHVGKLLAWLCYQLSGVSQPSLDLSSSQKDSYIKVLNCKWQVLILTDIGSKVIYWKEYWESYKSTKTLEG